MPKGITRKRSTSPIPMVGVGYIVVPHGVDRTTFVEDAMRREKVVIMPDEGSTYIRECPVSQDILSFLEFPPNERTLGSVVVFVTDSFHNTPLIIGVLSALDRSELSEESSFCLKRIHNFDHKTLIQGLAKQRTLTLLSESMSADALLLLKAVGKSGTEIKLSSSDLINLIAGGNFNLRSSSDFTITVDNDGNTNDISTIKINAEGITITRTKNGTSSSVTISDENVTITPNSRFNVKTGKEPMVLGSTLQARLNSLNTYVQTLVTATSTAIKATRAPEGAVAGAAFDTTMNARSLPTYTDINSSTSFTD